jgi:hypothetical protein
MISPMINIYIKYKIIEYIILKNYFIYRVMSLYKISDWININKINWDLLSGKN